MVIILGDQQNAQEGGKEKLSSLRRHYPDQVCGYFLSNPMLVDAPRFVKKNKVKTGCLFSTKVCNFFILTTLQRKTIQ